jgi:flagellar motor switch protein FliM
MVTELKVTAVEQMLYDEYTRRRSANSILNLVTFSPLPGEVILDIAPDLVFVLVDRLLGGVGALGQQGSGRTISDIEMALLESLLHRILDLTRNAWSQVTPIEPSLEQIIANETQFVQIALPSDVVVLVRMQMTVGETSGEVSFCIPYTVLEPVVTRLSPQVFLGAQRRGQRGAEFTAMLTEQVCNLQIPVIAILGGADLRVREVLSLRVGDVIRLDTLVNDPVIEVLVGKRSKFAARPGVCSGKKQMCFQVLKVLEDATPDMFQGGRLNG